MTRLFLRVLLCTIAAARVASAQTAGSQYVFTTLAGRAGSSGSADGTGTNALFNRPWNLAVDAAGNIFVTEAANHLVRKITPAGVVTTLAGTAGVPGTADGTGSAAQFGFIATGPASTPTAPSGPFGIALDGAGNAFVVDGDNYTIRRLTPERVVTTYAGQGGFRGATDGAAGAALFSVPIGVASDADGALYVADCFNHVIRRISPTGFVTTIAGFAGTSGSADGAGSQARFLHPTGLATDAAGNLYVGDSNNTVRRVSPPGPGQSDWTVTTLAGTPGAGGGNDGVGALAQFGIPAGTLANITIRFTPANLAPSTGIPTYAIGDLSGLATDAAGNVYVADAANHTIRKITPARVVTTIGGIPGFSGNTDGLGSTARFRNPSGVAVDAAGYLYIADSLNHTIRKGTPAFAPSIQTSPASQTATTGTSATLSVVATGFPSPTFQWTRNGLPLAGATAATLTLANLQLSDAAAYAVIATNVVGSATSASATLAVVAPPPPSAPAITAQPVGQSVLNGQNISLGVAVTGFPAPSIQWFRNGVPVPGATSATLLVNNAQADAAGNYAAVVTNSAGSVTSAVAVVAVNTGRLVNLSIRSALVGGEPLIAGFVVRGGGKPLLIRAVGPALRQFGVAAAMADPQLSLQSAGLTIAANDNWGSAANAPQVALAATQVGAFPLPADSLDAALLSPAVTAGTTAQAAAKNNGGGIVLLELYDVEPTAAARLVNVSARAQVGTGDDVLVAGFVLTGNSPRTLLLRAIGPALAAFGVNGALLDPRLDLFAAGVLAPRASNDNWSGDPALNAAFASVGAFLLPTATSKDAALIVTLEPGAYSAQVSGVGNTTGEALLEIYELP